MCFVFLNFFPSTSLSLWSFALAVSLFCSRLDSCDSVLYCCCDYCCDCCCWRHCIQWWCVLSSVWEWILNSDQIFACMQAQSHSRWGSRSHSSIAYRTWCGAVRDRCFVVKKKTIAFVFYCCCCCNCCCCRHCYWYSQRFCLSTNTCSDSKNFVLLKQNFKSAFFFASNSESIWFYLFRFDWFVAWFDFLLTLIPN